MVHFFEGKIQKLFQTGLTRNLPKQEVYFHWNSFSFFFLIFQLFLIVVMFELTVFVVRGLKVDSKSTLAQTVNQLKYPLASSGIVCYAGNLFGSVPCANGYNLASS